MSKMTPYTETNYLEDSKLMEFLNNDNNFEELDMGEIDDEDKPFILVDKDTGKIYDIRNENVVQKLSNTSIARSGSEYSAGPRTPSASMAAQKAAWSDWWKEKR